ncbi:pentapeptide repeat-containing protein [Streptomyces buecherae]|uniref:pentapeptide repeat-containing protein n=1 Tax=Streptomyces buecherae TaxID=2763006 RepID=UPI0037A2FADD
MKRAQAILNALTRDADAASFGSNDTKAPLDLRGLSFQGHQEYAPDNTIATRQGLTLENIDFTNASIPGLQLNGALVINCTFKRARLKGLECWGTIFRNCSFEGADMRGSQLSLPLEGAYSAYEATDFSRANLIGANCADASFRKVNFSRTKLNGINFRGSDFTDCSFAGTIKNVTFSTESLTGKQPRASVMQGIDFSEATLRDIEFRHIDTQGITFPVGDPHVMVDHYHCTLTRAVEALPVKGKPFTYGLRAYLATELGHAHPERTLGIWHRASLGKTTAEQEFAIALLKRAESECASKK